MMAWAGDASLLSQLNNNAVLVCLPNGLVSIQHHQPEECGRFDIVCMAPGLLV